MTNTTPIPQKRPVALAILTWVLFLSALVNILAGGLNVYSYSLISKGGNVEILTDESSAEILTEDGTLLVEGIWFLLVGVGELVITIGFWRVFRWAWVAAMSWQALTLLVDVANGLAGNPEVVSLTVSILLVLLLNQSDVRRVFGIRRNPNEPPSPSALNYLDSH